MNWKAVGIESGKTYATGTHADCSRVVNQDEHTEAIKVIHENEYIRSEEEETEFIAERMRQVKEEKHIQLQIKKAALADQKRIDAERKKAQELPTPYKRGKGEWTCSEEAFVKTNINMPNRELIAELEKRFGKIVTEHAVKNRKYNLRKQFDLPARSKVTWTQEEDDYIIKHYHRLTAAQVGEDIGRTKSATEARVRVLRRSGSLDYHQRYDEKQSCGSVPELEAGNGIHESGEHLDMGVAGVNETVEKMDTIQIIKPEKADKTAIHMTICKQLNQTYQEKNADYGDSFGETYRKLGIISAVTQISHKTNRLISLAGKPEADRMVKDESIADTLRDMANYAILTLMEMEEAK